MGWFSAIIAGGIAGWLAEKIMHSNMGLLSNIILGIIGAIVGGAILDFVFGYDRHAGWIAYIGAGVVGACLLIVAWRAIRGGRARA